MVEFSGISVPDEEGVTYLCRGLSCQEPCERCGIRSRGSGHPGRLKKDGWKQGPDQTHYCSAVSRTMTIQVYTKRRPRWAGQLVINALVSI